MTRPSDEGHSIEARYAHSRYVFLLLAMSYQSAFLYLIYRFEGKKAVPWDWINPELMLLACL